MSSDNQTERMEIMIDDSLSIHADFSQQINFLFPFAKELDELFKELRPESFEVCEMNFTQTLEAVKRYLDYLNSVMFFGEERAEKLELSASKNWE